MSVEIQNCEHPADAIRADSKFHIELAASSGSVRLTRQEVALQAEVGPLVWVDPAGHKDAAAEDHTKIVDAIRNGDAVRARALAEEHVRRDMNLVIDERMELDRAPTDSPHHPASVDDTVAAIESLAAMFYGTAATSMRELEQAVRATIGSGVSRDRADSDIYGAARRAVAIGVSLLYGTGFIADQSYFGESWNLPGAIRQRIQNRHSGSTSTWTSTMSTPRRGAPTIPPMTPLSKPATRTWMRAERTRTSSASARKSP